MPWTIHFHEPIIVDGRKLSTLRDAGEYICQLPPHQQNDELWQIASGLLLQATEHGGTWVNFARLSIMQALYGATMQPPQNARDLPNKRAETRSSRRRPTV